VRTALVWSDALAQYHFTDGHPLNPRRLELTLALIRALGLIDDVHRIVEPRVASDDEILTIHAPDYVDAVRRASAGARDASLLRYGIGTADVPIVEGMHDASLRVCGATLTAAGLIAAGDVTRAFSIAGGLHHARRAEAAGFCVYNDLAVAARMLQQQYGMRVLVVDIDAHHGDGTQQLFYDTPEVLTLSLHESGTFLWPGTGFIDELGAEDGYGFSLNVPLDPRTGDASFMHALRELLPPVADAFDPDIIVLQAGCDAHVLDPLTHLRCTTSLYEQAVRLVCDVADLHCGGRVLASGGGGYAIPEVVPRAWSLVWATLCGVVAPDDVPASWLGIAQRETDVALPRTLRDAPGAYGTTSHDDDDHALMNAQTVDAVRTRCLPLITGWGLAF